MRVPSRLAVVVVRRRGWTRSPFLGSTRRRREADHELRGVLTLLSAVELLLGTRAAFDGVADQEAVVGSRVVHGLHLRGDGPLPIPASGGSRGGGAGGQGLVAPGDAVLGPLAGQGPGLEGAAGRRRGRVQAESCQLDHAAL